MSLARAFLLAGLSPAQTLSRINDALARQDTSSMRGEDTTYTLDVRITQ